MAHFYRHTLLVLLTLLTSGAPELWAQDSDPEFSEWSIGVRGGPNLNNGEGRGIYATRANTTWFAGAVIAYRKFDWISVEVRPQYSEEGITASDPFYAPDAGWVTLDLRYAELPVVMKAETSLGPLRLGAYYGLGIGVLLSESMKIQEWDSELQNLRTVSEENLGSRISPINITDEYGISLGIDIASGVGLMFDAGLSAGRYPVIEGEGRYFIDDEDEFINSYTTMDLTFAAALMINL